MTVALVGSGPAREAVTAALGDVDEPIVEVSADDITEGRLAVVVGQAGETTFETANFTAGEAGIPWIAVEIGGLGGYPVVEAAVSGFGPGTGCYDCLQTRVAANAEPDQEPQGAPDPETARFAGALAGREAAKLVAGRQSTILGSCVEIPHAQRRLHPVPGCQCTGSRDRRLERNHVDRSVEAALARAESALDDRVGIVSEVGEIESFPVPYYLANLAETERFSDATAAQQAAGVDSGWDSAFMKALGEALERYCAGVYREAAFQTGTPAAVDSAVPPSTFVRPEGANWTTPGEDTEVAWVGGKNLVTGGDVKLPAEFVHFPPPDEQFRPAVTTGLGLGSSTDEALLSGLYEVIERDATMLAWYSTFDPLELDVADSGFEELVARAGSEGLSVTPLLVTQDVDVPVVAVAVHREAWPAFAVGSSAHLDAATAARSALTEALQNWLELDSMGREGAADASGAIGQYADFPEAAQAFVDTEQTVPADSVGPAEVPTGPDHLDALTDRLQAADLAVYAARTTTPDIAGLGFEAVRALVPTAQPLFFGDPFFGERAETVPPEIGFEPRLDRDHHPYP